jgi:hypothetical protein
MRTRIPEELTFFGPDLQMSDVLSGTPYENRFIFAMNGTLYENTDTRRTHFFGPDLSDSSEIERMSES